MILKKEHHLRLARTLFGLRNKFSNAENHFYLGPVKRLSLDFISGYIFFYLIIIPTFGYVHYIVNYKKLLSCQKWNIPGVRLSSGTQYWV